MPKYPNRETFVRMVSLLSKGLLVAAFLENSIFKTFSSICDVGRPLFCIAQVDAKSPASMITARA
jgi:hypothetical protein